MAARGPVAQSQQPAPTNFQATPSHKFRKPSTTTSPPGVSSPADPYAHLTPERRAQMEAELKQAENAYSGRFREAEAIADPVEAKTRIDSLKNSYNTKQSMIRKKYGVRLRERRTRAQIEEERQRMGLKGIHTVSSSAAGTPSKAATQAQPRIVSSTASAPPPPASQPAPAAPRVSGWTSINAGPSAAALDADASKGPSSTAPETASATEYSRAEKRRRTDSGDSDSVTARDNTSALAQAAEALFAQHYRATHAVTNGTTGGDGGGRAASSEGNSRPGSSSGAAATGGRTPLPSGSGAGAGVKRDVDGDVRMRRTSESPSPKPVANGPVRRPPDVRAGDGDVSSDSDSDIGDIPPTLPGSGGSTSQQQNRIASSGAPAQAPPRLAA